MEKTYRERVEALEKRMDQLESKEWGKDSDAKIRHFEDGDKVLGEAKDESSTQDIESPRSDVSGIRREVAFISDGLSDVQSMLLDSKKDSGNAVRKIKYKLYDIDGKLDLLIREI